MLMVFINIRNKKSFIYLKFQELKYMFKIINQSTDFLYIIYSKISSIYNLKILITKKRWKSNAF